MQRNCITIYEDDYARRQSNYNVVIYALVDLHH